MPRVRNKSETRNERLVALLLSWFSQNARDLPWRRTRDPYAIWVSEIMLQQTQVKTVIPFWERWMRELPTIGSLTDASSEKIHKLWEGLGYYTRVRNMQKAAQQIVQKSGKRKAESGNSACEFPKKFDDVLALPGIGRYTAGAICSIAFNQPTAILDGNVIRVLTRIFGIPENPREKETNTLLWKIAEELVGRAKDAKMKKKISFQPSQPSRSSRDNHSCSFLNQSLMELGALICTPRSPQCGICPAQKLCIARKENRQEALPNLGKRIAATERRFAAFVIERDGKYLVRRRPPGVVNAHLWEFPNVEHVNGELDLHHTAKALSGAKPSSVELLCTVKHSITRYRITLEAFRVDSKRTKSSESLGDRWHTLTELQQLSFPSAHKKILAALAEAG